MKNTTYYSLILLSLLIGCTSNKENDTSSKRNNKKELKHVQETVNNNSLDYSFKYEEIDFQKIDLYELNEMAVIFLEQGKFESIQHIKDSLLGLSLLYSERIIERDSSFVYAYINKSAAYSEIKSYESAIEVLLMLKRLAPIYPDATFRMGIISEKIGNDSSAYGYYQRAFIEYQDYFATPNATAADDINFEFLYLLLEGKAKAINRLDEKLKSSPNNPTYLMLKKNFQEFNRKEYISDF